MATSGKKGIVRFKLAPGYSGRKNKHVPDDEYQHEFDTNLESHIRAVENAGYKVTAPRLLNTVRAAVNKRHGFPNNKERKDNKEKKRTPWQMYLKERMGPLIKDGYSFQEAVEIVAEDWTVEKHKFKTELEQKERENLAPALKQRYVPARGAPKIRHREGRLFRLDDNPEDIVWE